MGGRRYDSCTVLFALGLTPLFGIANARISRFVPILLIAWISLLALANLTIIGQVSAITPLEKNNGSPSQRTKNWLPYPLQWIYGGTSDIAMSPGRVNFWLTTGWSPRWYDEASGRHQLAEKFPGLNTRKGTYSQSLDVSSEAWRVRGGAVNGRTIQHTSHDLQILVGINHPGPLTVTAHAAGDIPTNAAIFIGSTKTSANPSMGNRSLSVSATPRRQWNVITLRAPVGFRWTQIVVSAPVLSNPILSWAGPGPFPKK